MSYEISIRNARTVDRVAGIIATNLKPYFNASFMSHDYRQTSSIHKPLLQFNYMMEPIVMILPKYMTQNSHEKYCNAYGWNLTIKALQSFVHKYETLVMSDQLKFAPLAKNHLYCPFNTDVPEKGYFIHRFPKEVEANSCFVTHKIIPISIQPDKPKYTVGPEPHQYTITSTMTVEYMFNIDDPTTNSRVEL